MNLQYAPPFPSGLTVAAAGLLAAGLIWFWRRSALHGAAKWIVALLRIAAAGLLLWVLSGPHRLTGRSGEAPQLWLLTDASRSMDFPAGDVTRAALAAYVLKQATTSAHASESVRPVWFGSRLHAGTNPPAADDPVRSGSRPAGALRELLSSGGEAPAGVVLLSDGAAEDAAALSDIARTCARRGIPISVLCTGGQHEVRNLSITACDAPRAARAATLVPVTVTVRREGCRLEAIAVQLVDTATGKTVDEAAIPPEDTGAGVKDVTMHCLTSVEGFTGEIRVTTLTNELSESDNLTPFRIVPADNKLRILYMEGTNRTDHGVPEPLFFADALASDGMDVDILVLNVTNDQGGSVLVGWPWKTDRDFKPDKTQGYPRTREELCRYDVIICSDIPRIAFTDEQIQWTMDFVADRGGAFIMIGGKSAFGSGLWDQTPWEKLIPLDMAGASRGLTFENFKPFWPGEARLHPLLAPLPLESGETLDAILDAHPLFLGTNFVKRAKPAATVIMSQGTAEGMPIMAVEQFGKGRTMGFASDVTFFWGTFHNRAWGPPETAVQVVPNTESGDARNTPAPFYNNAYFRRFWIHAMHWLAEGSLRAHGSDFIAGTPLLTWTAGEPLPVHATCGDESLLTKLAGGTCTAEVTGIRSTRTRLRFDSRAGRFEGFLPRPPDLPGECEVVVEAHASGASGKRRAAFKVRSPVAEVELAEPAAKPEVLEPVAAITGGRVLHSAADTVAWLNERHAQLAASGNLARTPAWDRSWILASVLGLLSVEWLIRRFHS